MFKSKPSLLSLSILLISICSGIFLFTTKSVQAADTYDGKDFLDYQYQNSNQVVTSNNPSLTVGTYNIASGLHDHQIKPKLVGKGIKTLNADFIGLQEVDKGTKRNHKYNVAKMISKYSGMKYYYYHPTIKVPGGSYGTAVLSKYPIQKVGAYKLYSGKEEQRQMIIAKVKIPNFKRPVYFVNIHTAYQVDGKIRSKQMDQLNELLNDDLTAQVQAKFPNIIGATIIAMGDFNASSKDPTMQKLTNMWTEQRDPKRSDYRSWPAMNPTVDYDHILTSSSQKWRVDSSYLPSAEKDQQKINWPKLSDHLPFVEKMTLTEY
ncbi:MAG TPA: endonuclease/exonuclease/phosphatase family protein [Candidatus Ligilactobacillus excrementipullorum]|nr:endonuclease/exonuclease/phosphatase family protein [Candidatus Ligilactobacillus excrementipullorum]